MFKRAAKFVGNSVKSTYNVFAWVGAKPLKDSTTSIAKMSKPIFKKEKYQHKGETFAEAMNRFHLTDNDLMTKEHGLTQQVYLFLSLAGILTLYLFYLIIRLDLLLALIVAAIISLVLCKFYQAHYRRYCIRERSLEKSFSDWRKSFLGVKRSE